MNPKSRMALINGEQLVCKETTEDISNAIVAAGTEPYAFIAVVTQAGEQLVQVANIVRYWAEEK